MAANKAAKRMIRLPTNSRRMASHLGSERERGRGRGREGGGRKEEGKGREGGGGREGKKERMGE